MKTLIAYQTKGGATRTYAEAIAQSLKSNGFEVDLYDLKNTKPDITKYQLVIVGAGVRMFIVYGRWKKILKHKRLGETKFAMFLTSGTAIENPEEAIEKWVNPLIEKYKLKPLAVGSFPGIVPEKFDEKGTMQNAVKPEIASQWAQEIADKLRS